MTYIFFHFIYAYSSVQLVTYIFVLHTLHTVC